MATESASLVHLKTEDLNDESSPSLDVQHDDATAIKREEEPALPAALPKAAAAPVGAVPIDEGFLVPLHPAQASQRPFPPHCPVLYVTPTTIVMGMVESVFIDLSSETRKFIYRILDKDSTPLFVTEQNLQWARSCPVWASLSSSQQQEVSCVVETIYQKTRQSEPLYTLVANDGSLHHCIPKKCIRFRNEKTAPNPTMQQGNLTSNTIDQVEGNRLKDDNTGLAPVSKNKGGQSTSAQVKATPSKNGNESTAAAASTTAHIQDSRQDNNSTCRLAESRQPPAGCVHSIAPAPTPSEKTLSIKRTHDEDDKESCKKAKTGVGNLGSALSSSRYASHDKTRGGKVVLSEERLGDNPSELKRGFQNHSEQLETTLFAIPNNLFDVDNVQDFYRRARANGAIRKLTTQFRLENHPTMKNRMCIRLSGSEQDITEMSNKIERLVYEAVDKDNKERALHALALSNKYRHSIDDIAHQYLDGSRKKGKKWLAWRRLPGNFVNYICMVVGKNAKNKKRIMEETNCVIVINLKCRDPHYFIHGDTSANVLACLREMKQSVQDAKADWESRQT